MVEIQSLSSLIIGYIALTCVSSFADELKLIQVLFRHGEKSPIYESRTLYPLDPYLNETWYPEGWGALTKQGKRNAYQLGVYLKSRYGKWLGNVYLPDNVVFQSTNVHRTIMSSQLVAAALFSPTDIQRWNSRINWQPIPVFPISLATSYLYTNSSCNQKFMEMRSELERTDEFLLHRADELSDVFHFISRNVGRKAGQLECASIYDYLYGEMNENVELPEWTKAIFPDGQLEEIAAYDYIIQSYNQSMMKLNGGPWIREWLENVDNFLSEPHREHPKAFFYGGHEVNIGAMLVTLGVFEPHVPFFCSSVIFELFEIKGEFYVKILYRNRGVLQELLIPGCSSVTCPLATFRQLFTAIIAIQDREALCQ